MTKQNNLYYKTIDIPHLRATIHFMDISKLQGVPIRGSAYTTVMSQDENMNMEVGVFFTEIEKSVTMIERMPMIFHEIVHALQYIAKDRMIDMQEETEHFGYLASYITEKLIEN